ncbi:DUF1573 domain-containing protein [Haloferula sp. A504]|uniref:DUF1573 domain-containing protein n=1 Tax=Haloferula sp. A504 TaxID=3373601 RepID=UPI0031C841E1|nr:DUF1573 domain-containing protein [Verrucomicrobiaceae bacterium E54]
MRATSLGLVAGATLALALAGKAVASGVRFESKVVRLTVQPDAINEPLQWKCTNGTEIPLVVERFEQGCGCLAGAVRDVEIAPGKTGAIEAKFTPGPYRGLVRKSLHVRFVGFEKPVELVAEVTIPSTVELSARDLLWEADDRSSKVIEIEAGTKTDFRITGLVGVEESQFKLEQEILVAGRHYRLSLTPQDGVSPGHHVLQVRTDSPDRRDQVLAVFLKVEAPSGKEGAS